MNLNISIIESEVLNEKELSMREAKNLINEILKRTINIRVLFDLSSRL